MKLILAISLFILIICTGGGVSAYVIDHNNTNLGSIPATAINQAKSTLHIAYGHTSHGSQLTTGMTGLDGQTNLVGYKGDIYQWNEGGTGGALDIDDYFVGGDLGHNGSTVWADSTRDYLNNPANSDVNVVIWSWCGGASDNTPAGIQIYLDTMNQLENDYPHVTFVYMTGHADAWNDDTVKASNAQIRNYCISHNKILYDFFDIESYNPDGQYFEYVNDDCSYYNAAQQLQGNWASEWQTSHVEGVDWYQCYSAHSQPLNANRKAYAAWWLWSRIAGWDGGGAADTEAPTIPQNTTINIVSANQVEIFWEDSSDNIGVAGYELYYKQGDMSLPLDGIDATEGPSPLNVGYFVTSLVSGLSRDDTYYFAVKAYDSAGNKSAHSNIVSNHWMPELLAPSNNETATPIPTTFRWSTALSGMNVTYTLYYSTNPDLGFMPILPVSGDTPKGGPFAITALSIILGILLLREMTEKKLRQRYIPLALCAAIAITACGGSGSGSSSDSGSHSATVYSVDTGTADYLQTSDLNSQTTYYWRVIATDTSDPSITYTSETYHFTTD